MADDVEARHEMGNDEEVDFEAIEKQWLEALGCVDGDDEGSDDEYVDDAIETDSVVDIGIDDGYDEDVDDEVEMTDMEEELFELLEDSRIEQTLEDYVCDGAGLFSVAEM